MWWKNKGRVSNRREKTRKIKNQKSARSCRRRCVKVAPNPGEINPQSPPQEVASSLPSSSPPLWVLSEGGLLAPDGIRGAGRVSVRRCARRLHGDAARSCWSPLCAARSAHLLLLLRLRHTLPPESPLSLSLFSLFLSLFFLPSPFSRAPSLGTTPPPLPPPARWIQSAS